VQIPECGLPRLAAPVIVGLVQCDCCIMTLTIDDSYDFMILWEDGLWHLQDTPLTL